MRKFRLWTIMLAGIALLPTICFSASYSLERLFNQPEMEETLNAQLKLYRTEFNRDIDAIFDFRGACIDSLKYYLQGNNAKPDIALEALRQFLCTNILLAAIFDKENAPIDEKAINSNAKNTIMLYQRLNEAGLVDGDVDKFMYMYNNALNNFAPKLIRRL